MNTTETQQAAQAADAALKLLAQVLACWHRLEMADAQRDPHEYRRALHAAGLARYHAARALDEAGLVS